MADVLREFWGMVITAVAGLVWVLRLEGKALRSEQEIQSLRDQRKEDQETARHARVEFMSILHDMQNDIKQLLAKVGH